MLKDAERRLETLRGLIEAKNCLGPNKEQSCNYKEETIINKKRCLLMKVMLRDAKKRLGDAK